MTFAQKQANDSSLFKLVNRISSETEKYAPEKIYVQTDKPAYSTGDTLWFKIYVFDAAFLHPSRQSGVAYLEIAGQDDAVVKRIMVVLKDGLGWGYFALNETSFAAGTYTLTAYTNWTRNFNQKLLFRRQFAINNYSADEWLIRAQFYPTSGSKDQIESTLTIERQNNQPLSFGNLQIALTDGKKSWYKNTFRTDVNGHLEFNFKIPASADKKKLSLILRKENASASAPEITVPVMINRDSKIDLQFMPEGGDLIADMKNTVAFKAISEDGMGQDVSGMIYDSRRRVVDSFRSSHLGMGQFVFIPRKGEKYIASIKADDNSAQFFPLPEIKNTGYALQVINVFDQDSLQVKVFSAGGNHSEDGAFYLVAEARGIGCFGAKLMLKHGQESFHLSKLLFPSGIARFTIYDAAMQPVNQRMVFIDNHDLLLPDITGKALYNRRDQVNLNIKVLDKNGQPLQGSFSLAVTDDNKVFIDSLKRNSLASDILLTSDLKGYVESPGYYFPHQMTNKIWNDLDNLLLTQGWISYSRDTVSEPTYPAEQSFSIRGKVVNVLNKPVAGSQVLLFSRKPFSLAQTVTDANGTFNFSPLYPIDTASFMLQARNKRGKSFNVGITVDAFTPPQFAPLNRTLMPWYVRVDTARDHIIRTQLSDKEILDKLTGEHVLKEVVVVGQKAIQGSKNLNGPGGSDFALNQFDMEKAGKATLGDVLRQKVKGFHLGGKYLDRYLINTELVHLIIDGVNLDFFKPDGVSMKDYYKQYLDYITAEDVKGIEVMTSPKYTGAYFQKFLDPRAEPFDHVFIEVTTYSGNGAFLKKTPGVFLYKPPVAFSTPAHFYSPKYPVKEGVALPDVRSTIFWDPDIITNKNGEAEISFYTGDKPGTYTLILEGTDMNGNIGSVSKKINVK